MTAEEVYTKFIADSGHELPFCLVWYAAIDQDRAETKWRRFDSREHDYCIPVLEEIVASPDFLGFPVTWTKESVPSISLVIR